jgi:mycoredoxin
MALTFYRVPWCPECAVVKERLDDLKLTYEDVIVPDARMLRKQVHEVSGQYYVPVLKDDNLVLSETHDIVDYLDDRYGEGGSGTQAVQRFASRGRPKTAPAGEDDQFPSCRR